MVRDEKKNKLSREKYKTAAHMKGGKDLTIERRATLLNSPFS